MMRAWFNFLRRKSSPGIRASGHLTVFRIDGDPVFDDEVRRREAYARCFGTVDGRRVLADILVRGGIANPAYEPGGSPTDAAFNSGVHAGACSIAMTAGLDLGRMGMALVAGDLETMSTAEEPSDD